MRKMRWFVLALGLFLLASAGTAYADGLPVFPSETIALTGVATQTAGSNCCKIDSFIGSFTIGSLIPSTTDWTVTAFDAIPASCGASDCSTLVWTFSLTFDASTDSLFGTISTLFTGGGGDSRKFIGTFIDGNTSTDPFQNNDLTREALGDFTNDRSGTLAYTLAPVPEPSAASLLAFGLLLLAGLCGRRTFRFVR